MPPSSPPAVIKWRLGWHSWCSRAGIPSLWQLYCSAARTSLGQGHCCNQNKYPGRTSSLEALARRCTISSWTTSQNMREKGFCPQNLRCVLASLRMPSVPSHLQGPHDCRLLCVEPSAKSAHLLGIKVPKGQIPVHRAPKHKHALIRWAVAASHERAHTSDVSSFLKWISPRWRRCATALLWAWWTLLISLLATDLAGAFSPLLCVLVHQF